MFSVQFAGLRIEAETEEELVNASVHFSRLISSKEMAEIAGVSERTIARWVAIRNFPQPPARLCDFLHRLSRPLTANQRKNTPDD